MKIEIENNSSFPTQYLKGLINFILKELSSKMDVNIYSFVFEKKDMSWCYGEGGADKQIIYLKRHYRNIKNGWPFSYVDPRFKFHNSYYLKNRTEMMVFLITHEIGHSIWNNRRVKLYTPTIPESEHSWLENEYYCNELGYALVKKYRENKEKLWNKIKKDLKKKENLNVQ